MRPYPRRTLLLMALALLAFLRLYYVTHSRPEPAPRPPPVRATTAPDRGQACLTLDRALEGALKDPNSATTWATVRRELDACPTLPSRACELGAALDARAPLDDAGPQALRELLDTLCQRCPAGLNPCSRAVIRSVMAVDVGGQTSLTSPRWHLEHAGPGTAEACSEVVRNLLAPAALDEGPPPEPRQALLAQLAPICIRAGQVPAPILRAAAVQGDVPARSWIPPTETSIQERARLTPDRVVGAPGGHPAFDGKESTSVDLQRTEQDPSWRKTGAVSGVFEPPVHEASSLRVKARGAGTLRAAIRVESGLGLHDPDTQHSFLLPLVCRFKGTGQWEDCALPVSLLDVEAISVFPDKRPLMLSEVEILGTR
ncbi:hypothetical protein [Melittangium boletus]|uniref:Uncharacterized protein n=1 Tax=Melittangium boletus DSM 14713 TaxID=1294270 RepID=A0A250INE4_9BACT|nr:hypothetical protein [Melittangium boletus]ATB32711.1 hypothetical protein MEBOL_006200 [Melittangium boletus DSM 14713]